MNNELDEKNKLINEIANELKKDFENLSDDQKKLLAYRKIIELSSKGISLKDDEVSAVIEASDLNIGFLEYIFLQYMSNYGENYKELYRESLVSYNKILENYKLLAQELKINSSLELSHLFTYMLWNGYYSVTKQHAYKLQERLLLPGMFSFDVMKGKGVCLAYAELLHNYLTICDKTSAILECKVPTGKNKIVREYTPNINRNVESSIMSRLVSRSTTFLLKGLINRVGNHSVTLIEDNSKIYVYDPTNLYVLNVIDKDTATVINGNGNISIKPFSTLLMIPDSDPNHIFEKLLNGNIEQAYSINDIIGSYEYILNLINNNLSLLDDAYDNIHSELEFIDRQTDEIGGSSASFKKIRKKEN